MNIFKGLLFLEGYLTVQSLNDDDFGPEYGNKRASQRAFADDFAQPEFARRDIAGECSPAGCA